jgi:hypothetical protein
MNIMDFAKNVELITTVWIDCVAKANPGASAGLRRAVFVESPSVGPLGVFLSYVEVAGSDGGGGFSAVLFEENGVWHYVLEVDPEEVTEEVFLGTRRSGTLDEVLTYMRSIAE